MFNELKQVKYFKEIKDLKSVQVKAEVYLEPNWVSMMKIFSENNQQVTIFAKKTPSYVFDWVLQDEPKIEQMIAIEQINA